MKHKNTKGFTLVEIIVVLVIIAILAVTMLPALTGYINDARDKTALSEARTFLVASQSISSELYSFGCNEKNTWDYINGKSGAGKGGVPASYTKTVASLTGSSYFKDYGHLKQFSVDETGTVVFFELYTSNGRSVIYRDNTMTVGDQIIKKP